jgi:tetratricopeptide (TPR) repeat protein
MNGFKKIIEDVIANDSVIFCGAGISRHSGIPVVNEFINYVLEKISSPEDDKNIFFNETNLRIPFESFIQILKENSNITELLNVFSFGEPNSNHLLIASLIKAGKIKTVVTTNFDNLIEKALIEEPNALRQNNDFVVLYKNSDFENINWKDGKIKIIKIHGSIEEPDEIAITLKQVSAHILTKPRMSIIRHIFSTGDHLNVLVLGYSCSDKFDLCVQIESLETDLKKVYFLQHESNDAPNSENICEELTNNPFKKFKDSYRIKGNTDQFIKQFWAFCVKERYEFIKHEGEWKSNVNNWVSSSLNGEIEMVKCFIYASTLYSLGELNRALVYYKQAWNLNQKIEYKQGSSNCLVNIANTYYSLGEYSEALKYYKRTIGWFTPKLSKFNNLESQIKICTINGQTKKALRLYNTFLKEIDSNPEKYNKEIQLQVMLELGAINKRLNRYLEAENALIKAIGIAQEVGNKLAELNVNRLLAILYKLRDYDTEKSNIFFKKALKIAQDIGDIAHEHMCNADLNLNINKGHKNIEIEIIDQIENAIKVDEQMGNKMNLLTNINNIGNLFLFNKQFEKANKYFERGHLISKETGNIESRKVFLEKLGQASLEIPREINNSISFYKQALKIAKRTGDRLGVIICYEGIATYFAKFEDFNEHIRYSKIALKIARKIGDKMHEGILLQNIGSSFRGKGRKTLSIYYYQQALIVFNKIKDCEFIESTERALKEVNPSRN